MLLLGPDVRKHSGFKNALIVPELHCFPGPQISRQLQAFLALASGSANWISVWGNPSTWPGDPKCMNSRQLSREEQEARARKAGLGAPWCSARLHPLCPGCVSGAQPRLGLRLLGSPLNGGAWGGVSACHHSQGGAQGGCRLEPSPVSGPRQSRTGGAICVHFVPGVLAAATQSG